MRPDYKKFLGQIMNTRRLVIIFMIGVALIVLPGMLTGRTHKTETNKLVSQGTTSLDSATYTKELEKKLADILSTLRNVSDVSVMITLTDGGEAYYARNEKSDSKVTEDGTLQESAAQADGSLALKNESGGGQAPVLLKSGMPRVSGVLVTAKGVESPTVQTNVVNAVRAVLDVAAHRVQVLEKA